MDKKSIQKKSTYGAFVHILITPEILYKDIQIYEPKMTTAKIVAFYEKTGFSDRHYLGSELDFTL